MRPSSAHACNKANRQSPPKRDILPRWTLLIFVRRKDYITLVFFSSFFFQTSSRLALFLCLGKEKDRIFKSPLDFPSLSLLEFCKKSKMAFASFLGRVLFASVFILSAYQEFNEYGVDGGPAAKFLRPKFDAFAHRVHSHVGFQLPEIDIKYLVAGAIALKGLGGLLFIFGSTFGAVLLLLHQMITTPIVYDFYNYDNEGKEFNQLFIKFTQNMALFGALLFFIGMKNSIPRRQPKKKVPKTKTY